MGSEVLIDAVDGTLSNRILEPRRYNKLLSMFATGVQHLVNHECDYSS